MTEARQVSCLAEDWPDSRLGFTLVNPEARTEQAVPVIRRPRVHGKGLVIGDQKFWIRGVTYGTFRPDLWGENYPPPAVVRRDFAAMAQAGVNAVRLYTVPPRWLLDEAAAHGLRLKIGLPWEQHITFLDSRRTRMSIATRIRKGVRQCGTHPAILCYAVGNEIPASVVRWYGRRRVERFLGQLADVARNEDPSALVTYVNFPTTEYLDLSFVDLVAYNVYLETAEQLRSYLARLQSLAGECPLLMAEIGLDSRRNEEARQAEVLRWQIATAFEAGCVGSFVFAWTDEWHRGGHEIVDWDFGLVTRDRQPKPALAAVADAYHTAPFPNTEAWPRISVVVCSYNGAATIGETLSRLEHLDYPDYEIVVVDDGSTDATAAIAGRHDVRLIRTANLGLSRARNVGLNATTGSIVAYTDDDAFPDPHWLKYLAATFMRTDHAGVGGPNLSPPGDGFIAQCVANAPGGPTHVLISDEIAEHIPGCNMAFRKDHLMAVGGFDPQFRVAGDDVDLCWRLQERGLTIGFSPAATIWHHRRNSVRGYLKQQWGYARAEALLARKWPGKYNGVGHVTWHGRVYGKGGLEPLFKRHHIYHGTWGTAPFQSLYERSSGGLGCLLIMPEWYAALAFLGLFSAMSLFWMPMGVLTPLFAGGVLATCWRAARAARQASFRVEDATASTRLAMRGLTALLHLLQPAARLMGRIQYRLGPWRAPSKIVQHPPLPVEFALWSEQWQSAEARLAIVERMLLERGATVHRGSEFERWDLRISSGVFGAVRALGMVEEHGAGKQMFRLRAWPTFPGAVLVVLVLLGIMASAALANSVWVPGLLLAAGMFMVTALAYADGADAMARLRDALGQLDGGLRSRGSAAPGSPSVCGAGS